MSTQAIREYLHHVWEIYQRSSKDDKAKILDEICRNLNIHRKSAIRLMNRLYSPRSLQGVQGGKPKKYSQTTKQHLSRLWVVMGYMSPIRMKAALPEWLPFDHQLKSLPKVRDEILAMSASSIQRFLLNDRRNLRKKMNTGTRRGLRKFITQVPIREFNYLPTEPGYVEIDCVAHCGGSLTGKYVWTLTMTDIYSRWTECAAMWGKDGANVRSSLEYAEKRCPLPLKAIYCDNGSEFINDEVTNDFIKKHPRKIEIFRGRPYRKNDQCFVEQKIYSHVRTLFRYGRIDDYRAYKNS